MRRILLALAGLLALALSTRSAAQSSSIILKPARVFDGDAVHDGWAVRVNLDRIDAVGPGDTVAGPAVAGATVIDLPGTTLAPGLIEGHSHVLLHAYSETTWNDQVSHEGLALRRLGQSAAREPRRQPGTGNRLQQDPVKSD